MVKLTRKNAAEFLSELKKDELKEIASMYGLPVSGTKDELVSRILSNAKLSDLAKILEVKPESKQKEDVKPQAKQKKQDPEIDASKFFKEIVKLLKKITPPKVKNEDELELYVLGLLQGKFASRKIEVVPQTIAVSRGKTTQPDIVVGGAVAVELKYIKGADDSDRGIGQAVKYASTYPYVVLYYYDPQKRSHHSKSALGKNIELVVYPK
ncbi:SAP domain-containing protein [Archaeoglobus veneficus]|uniref:DNA-binding SAP domain protein n=1 Tax=Archaeoglobus veneficus (strain DSM 11195 / SNP6) TaxID=693661 RepID=F2KSD1_ARCVS|nr:SAP domain-containing protein [Archaeoglobus veneficus]AEA46900.1 DNA-binding SAP domain protein [Archaeoglobus veneficus SNP6]